MEAGDVSPKRKGPATPPEGFSPCHAPNRRVNTASSSTAPSPKADVHTLKIFDEDFMQDSTFGYGDMVDFWPQPSLPTFDFDMDIDSMFPPPSTLSTTLSSDTLQSTTSSPWMATFPVAAQTVSTANSGHAPQATTWTSAPVSYATEPQTLQAFPSQTDSGFFPPLPEHPNSMMDICCLKKTNQSLTELQTSRSRCIPSSAVNSSNLGHERPTMAQVIAANRKHFQSTIEVLSCTCARDGQTLFTVALIIFSIIAEYSKATRTLQQSEQDQTLPDVTRMPQAPQNGSRRLLAHLVLGELYRVVRMIELFASAHRQMKTDGDTSTSGMSNETQQTCQNDAIPVSIFGQMEADLREKLGVVRGSTLNILRQY